MTCTTRLATPADIPALSDLLGILFAQEVEFTPNPAAQARGLAQIINHPSTGLVLVLEEAGQIIGMVNILLTVSTALGLPVALLEDLIIAPPHRGQGRGSQLLNAAIEQAQVLGCARITLLTDADNLQAQQFYRAHGFSASTMLPMRKALPTNAH